MDEMSNAAAIKAVIESIKGSFTVKEVQAKLEIIYGWPPTIKQGTSIRYILKKYNYKKWTQHGSCNVNMYVREAK